MPINQYTTAILAVYIGLKVVSLLPADYEKIVVRLTNKSRIITIYYIYNLEKRYSIA